VEVDENYGEGDNVEAAEEDECGDDKGNSSPLTPNIDSIEQ